MAVHSPALRTGDNQSPEGLENGVEDMQVMYSDAALLHGEIELPCVSPQAAMQGGNGQSAAAEQVFMYLQVCSHTQALRELATSVYELYTQTVECLP